MNAQIENAIKRGRGYWFVDGFTEMLAGSLFVLMGAALLLRGMASQDSILAGFVSVAADIGFIKVFGIVAAILILWWLKEHFTYPRSGFVREKRVTWTQMLSFLRNAVLFLLLPVLILVAALIFLPLMRGLLFAIPAWMPVFLSIIWGIGCFLAGSWMGLRRFEWLGAFILLAGIGIGAWQLAAGLPALPVEALQSNPFGPLPEVLRLPLESAINRTFASVGWLTLLSGMFFVISGLAAFLHYRKENPAPYQEEV